jgi:uncharacterized membrane-anchored protein YitT (DUF2179 family)
MSHIGLFRGLSAGNPYESRGSTDGANIIYCQLKYNTKFEMHYTEC